MGYNQHRIEVTALTSSHNDERDGRDERLLDELRAAISALAEDPKYRPISPMVS